jgi:dihydrofolate synthase/folylpolyglutamate synthase
LETIDSDPPIVIDVGHTPDAIRVALDGFASLRGDRPSILVCGASADKNAAAMIAALAPAFAHIICASARHKGAPVAEMAAAAASVNPSAEITIAESVTDARRLALAKARTLNAAIYVAGGLFLAAEFKAAHLGLDPQSLAFF